MIKPDKEISAFGKTFWDLFIMKIFRNIASVKYQWLLLLYIPTIWGMFNLNDKTGEPWVPAALGLGFLGGGFVTLATSRIITRTSLTESKDGSELDTDK